MPATTDSPSDLLGLVLRPGAHVLRRSATELQVGLDPRRAVVLPDRPTTRTLLDALANPAAPATGEYDEHALAELTDGDLLVDAGRLLPLAPSGPAASRWPTALSRCDVAALAARTGDRTASLVAARVRTTVGVVPLGSPDAHAVCAHLQELLTEAGIAASPGPPQATAPRRAEPAADVLVCVGEPVREQVDAWTRSGRPHLLLRLTEGDAVVGPFVVPGESTCLRCVDAHHTDHDPAWPLLLTQYASAVARERPDGLAEPLDGLLTRIAAAWAAREIVSYAEGDTPRTTSSTMRIDRSLTALETHSWPRHPACGCTWA